jgi:signal transduction histidine kinase
MGWCWEWRTCCTRTLGEQVSLRTELAASLWSALADDNQLENAILNVAINSRDAMPDGGQLTIGCRRDGMNAINISREHHLNLHELSC